VTAAPLFSSLNAQSLVGLLSILVLCWGLSENRWRFPWRLLAGALAVQLGLLLLFFGFPPAQAVLGGLSAAVEGLSTASQTGAQFVFGYLAGGTQPFDASAAGAPYIFAFRVLPVIPVICALSALLWYWGVLRFLAKGFGIVFERVLGMRGPTALATAATIFMGQVEGPILIRAYLEKLTRSEIFTLMAVGMTCVSGSAMVAYAAILKGVLPDAAAHVFTASVISAPAGVLLSQILAPPEKTAALDKTALEGEQNYQSSIDAIMSGTAMGLQVVLSIAATLIVFVALVTMANGALSLGPRFGGEPLTVQRGLELFLRPLSWAMGVPWQETGVAGHLLAQKLVLTEFTAFFDLSRLKPEQLSERARLIMTYALCGFANIGSVGVTGAGFGVIAPNRRSEILAMLWRALLVGFLATCFTAALVGALPWRFFAS